MAIGIRPLRGAATSWKSPFTIYHRGRCRAPCSRGRGEGSPQSLVSLLLEEATPQAAGAPCGEGGGGHLPQPGGPHRCDPAVHGQEASRRAQRRARPWEGRSGGARDPPAGRVQPSSSASRHRVPGEASPCHGESQGAQNQTEPKDQSNQCQFKPSLPSFLSSPRGICSSI
ncbi:hypothetical protein HJG60_008093 [Phyllostomus discolor]|uniref:Uncharacterized protein n=1 Tax=Phyllostomus discolor TaxID=89673 RepID=A0A834BLD9_9CHIR|nr:hypothetical protein HJG60_008093 [Phyllostomus discolor]